MLKVVIELLRAQCETVNQQPVTAKECIIQFHKEGECPVRKQKNSNMKLLNGANDWKASVDLKTSLQFPVHIIQTKAARHGCMVRFKEECPPHRIDCPLGRKLERGT